MKKLCSTLIILLIFGISTLFADMKRYEIKSGEIEYEIIGSGKMMGIPSKTSGNAHLVFKDYGNIELNREKTIQEIMGQKDIAEDIIKIEDGIVYSVDLEDKIIYKQKLPSDPNDLALKNKGKKSLESLGGKKIGTDKVAGYKCDVWELSGTKICLYKGVPLKTEVNSMGIVQVQIAKSVKFNISIDKDKFKLPDYPVESMDEKMKENQKQMDEQMKNMSPEQKKMMQDMMKNMGGMFSK